MSDAIQVITYIHKRMKHYGVPAKALSTDSPERLLNMGALALREGFDLVFNQFGDRWHSSIERKGRKSKLDKF